MLIHLERSGGFSGISKEIRVETDKLSQNKYARLLILLEPVNFFSLPTNVAPESHQNDRFQYTLTIEEKNKHHSVTFSESAMPENIRPLIEWIQTNAQ